jgi:hypothetical protein
MKTLGILEVITLFVGFPFLILGEFRFIQINFHCSFNGNLFNNLEFDRASTNFNLSPWIETIIFLQNKISENKKD